MGTLVWMLLWRRLLAPTLGIVTALAVAAPAGAAGSEEPWRPFAPDSLWNLRLRDDVPLNPKSATYVSELQRLVNKNGAWVNDHHCGMPLYWAGRKTSRGPVKLDDAAYEDPRLLYAWRSVPVPKTAKPAECSDANMAVGLRRRDGRISVWEFWRARKTVSNGRVAWHAKWGGYTDDVRHDRGIASKHAWQAKGKVGWQYRSDPQWNVTASSVSMIAGVITREDVAAGRADHALSMAVTDMARGKWFFPAQRTDGSLRNPEAIPAGSRFRLDPALDLSKLDLSPAVRMIAEAVQRYGVVVRDRTYGPNVFYTDGRPGKPVLTRDDFGGKSPNEALKKFPWDKMQLIDAPLCVRTYGRCEVKPKLRISTDASIADTRGGIRLDTSNSALNQPRKSVKWDLDGDGEYETRAGRKVKITLPRGGKRPKIVRVKITTLDGETYTAVKRLRGRPTGKGAVAGASLFVDLRDSLAKLMASLQSALAPADERSP